MEKVNPPDPNDKTPDPDEIIRWAEVFEQYKKEM